MNSALPPKARLPLALLTSVSCAAMTLRASESHAQQSSASVESPSLAAVVVTATRRKEPLQHVPIADTAITAKNLTALQIVDVTSLGKFVPGMQVKPTISPLNIIMSIRGVSQLNINPAQDPPIGVYVDGVYNAINPGSDTAMIDMERVEVLRGPQGTLFGRNTIGGAVSIITAKPTDSFGGYVQADGGNYGARGLLGVVNLPISPGLLDMRLVYQHNQHDGYGRNFFDRTPTNTLDQDYFRGSLRLTPSNHWDVLVTGFHTYVRGYSAATKLGYMASPFNASYPTASGHPGDLLSNYVDFGGPQDSDTNLDGTYALRQHGVTATITGYLSPAVTVKSITGYTHTQYEQVGDSDGTPYTIFSVSIPVQANQESEELQAYGDAFDNRLKWIDGLYFFNIDGSQISTGNTLPYLRPAAARTYNVTGPYVSNQSYSAYAQVTYDLTPKLRLTGGVRYVLDDRGVTYRDQTTELAGATPGAFVSCDLANAANLNSASPTVGALGTRPAGCVFKDSAQYSYAPWTVGLDYQPNSDALLYVKLSQGYRSGAFSATGPIATPPLAPPLLASGSQAAVYDQIAIAAFRPVPPESLLSPEIGTKLQFFDRKLTIDAAAYYSRYNDIQNTVNVISNGLSLNELQNAGDAKIWGYELEGTALLGKLVLDGQVGVTRPTYTSSTIPGTNLPNPYYGTTVVNVSKFNGSITGTYPIETSAGTLALTGTYSYRSAQTFYPLYAATPAAEVAASSQKGFGLLDARASFTLANSPIIFSIYGQNLTNQVYKTAAADLPSPLAYAIYWNGAPRTIGASVKYRF